MATQFVTSILLISIILQEVSAVTPADFTIGTWNSFDILYGSFRDARRQYFFDHKNELFGDLDILCTQESFTYESIATFESNFGELFPYSYHNNDPSSSLTACTVEEMDYFLNTTSPIYACSEACANSKLPSTLANVFCVWQCFGDLLRDRVTGITNRTYNPTVFDLGQGLELGACLNCLWRSKYVDTAMKADWSTYNATSDEMYGDILDLCASETNTFDFKPNEGVMLWSKYEFDQVEFFPLADAIFIPRGSIIATWNNAPFLEEDESLTVICSHLETPTINANFGGKFVTMIQDNIDNKAIEMSNITEIEIAQLIEKINSISGNVVILGDLNIGINSRIDLYEELVSGAGLRNVFGSTYDELVDGVGNCSRCSANPLAENQEIIDHILIRDSDSGNFQVSDAMRFVDEVYNTSDGLWPLSDHYGIKSTLSIVPTGTVDTTAVPVTTDSSSPEDDGGNVIVASQWMSAAILFVAFLFGKSL